MQLRHPQEAGGFAFLVSVLLSLVGSLVLAYIYSNYDDDEEGVNIEIDDDTLKATLINLYSVWLFSIVCFVSVINKKFLLTFYNFDNTSDYRRKMFLALRDDQAETKSSIILTLTLAHPDTFRNWGDTFLKPWCFEAWEWYRKMRGRVDDPKRRRGSVSVRELLGEKEMK
ncbi:hypothetical protein TrLO_g10512 [Triparma laevis f. longispina]|uniref:Uncharacterized protein n=1 Tax=Triparma laevis f. longispina TaxID=1714387 RepID=A0A9W7FME9_9STRA|nr:hypothetical protein TrLO_g10512 [Triparma laevis f. longispina]